MSTTVHCDQCARPFTATRADALTCGAACRQRRRRERLAHRATVAAELLQRQVALHSRALAEGYDVVASDLAALQRDARRALAA
ncbi:hypothetical protein CXR34_13455 [Microbacterium hominis]|uniref:Uncharacterized protein n=1 Tax=Microbacterium hominis TaxID=162426 RepID=A0A2K9DWX0_9MICO|nr:hypothetical protein CXR34_13455 [Microbacterium hominis]